jgi:cell division protein FtsL
MQTHRERGISFGVLTVVLTAMAIVLLLALVKIYLSHRIYYESRRINNLEREVAALREENTLLHMRVEKLKYKTQVTDTIFTLEENQRVSPEKGNP